MVLQLLKLESISSFTTDLIVDQFAFKKDTIGTLTIHVDNKAANTYNTSVSITGQDNLVDLNGTYKTGDGNLDLNLDISRLNLKSIQGFTLNNLKESTGFLTGILKLQEIQISQNWLAICSLMTSDLRSPT
jgi:hypothetical protein